MTQSRLTPEKARELKQQGWTHAEIANEYGLTVSGVQQSLQRIGYVHKRTSHKAVKPWTVAKEHAGRGVDQNLRRLSLLSQGEKLDDNDRLHEWYANTAIGWANEIIDAEMDVDYDRDAEPSEFSPAGGYYLKKADPENWHLKKVMNLVQAAQARKPQ